MVRRCLNGGAYLAGDDIASYQIADVVQYQIESVGRQAFQFLRQSGQHHLGDDGALQEQPRGEQKERRYAGPQRGIETVIAGQRMQVLNLAARLGKGPSSPQVIANAGQSQQGQGEVRSLHHGVITRSCGAVERSGRDLPGRCDRW